MATSTALAGFCSQPSHKNDEWTSVVASAVETLPAQQEWSGSWDWKNAEEEALLEWCNTAQQECTSQPDPCHLSPVPDEHMKRFLLLKSKIIDTHKLIKKYQDKEKALKTATEKLVEVQASCTALRSELMLQHELNGSLSEQLSAARKQLEETLQDTSHQKKLIQQLTAKLEETEADRDLMLHGKTGRNHLLSEVDRLRKELKAVKEKSHDPLYKFNHMKCDVVAPVKSDPLSHLAVRSTGKKTKPNNMCVSPLPLSDQDCSETDDDDEEEEEKDVGEEKGMVEKKVKDMAEDDDDDWCSDEEDMLADILCEDIPQTIVTYSPRCIENTAGNDCTQEPQDSSCRKSTEEHTVPLDSRLDSTQEDSCMKSTEEHMEPLDSCTKEHMEPLDSCMKSTKEHMEPLDSCMKSTKEHMEPLDSCMKSTEEHVKSLDNSTKEHMKRDSTHEHTVPLDNTHEHIVSLDGHMESIHEHIEPQYSCMKSTQQRLEPLDGHIESTQEYMIPLDREKEHTVPLDSCTKSINRRREHTEPLDIRRRQEHTEPLDIRRRQEHTEPLDIRRRQEHAEPLDIRRRQEHTEPLDSHRRQEHTEPLDIRRRQEHTEPLDIRRRQEHTEPLDRHRKQEHTEQLDIRRRQEHTEPLDIRRRQEHTEPLDRHRRQEHTEPLDIRRRQEHTEPLDIRRRQEHTEPLDIRRRQEHTEPLDIRRRQEHTEPLDSHRRQEHTEPLDIRRRQEHTEPLDIRRRQEHTEPLDIRRRQEHTEPLDIRRRQEHTEPLDSHRRQEHTEPLDIRRRQEHTEPLDRHRRQEHTEPLDRRRRQEHTESLDSHMKKTQEQMVPPMDDCTEDTQEHTVLLASCIESATQEHTVSLGNNDQLPSHKTHEPRGSQKRRKQESSSQSKRARLAASPTPLLPSFSPQLPSSNISCLGRVMSGPVSTDQAEADSATSVESDNDSMDSLWHLPRFSRLQTVSPLPPSPLPPSPPLSPLSPLSFFPPVFTTLSPIPPSPNRTTISPLPISPPHNDLNSPSLPRFFSQAPTEQCIHPTPLTPSASTSPLISPPPQRLKRSLSSSFSPPTKLTCSPSQPTVTQLSSPPSTIAVQTPSQPSDSGAAPLPKIARSSSSPAFRPTASSSLYNTDSQSSSSIRVKKTYLSQAKKEEESLILPPFTSQNPLSAVEEEEGEIVEHPTPPLITSLNSLPSPVKDKGEIVKSPKQNPLFLAKKEIEIPISSLPSSSRVEEEEGEIVSSPTPSPIPLQNPLLSTKKEEGESVESPAPLTISSLPSSPFPIHVPDPSSPGSPCPLSILDQEQQEEEPVPSSPLLILGSSTLLSPDSPSSLSIVVMDSSVQHCQPEPSRTCISDHDSSQQPVEESSSSFVPDPSNHDALSSFDLSSEEVLIQPLEATEFSQSVGYSNPTPPPTAKRPKLDKATGQELKAGSRSSSSSTSPELSGPSSEFSFAQKQLSPSQKEVHAALRSPHPLPVWLTASLVAVQDAINHSMTNKNNRKKRKKGSCSINRSKKQSPASYASNSLSRLMDGLVTMPTATRMFSNPDNAPCPVVLAKTTVTYLCQNYHPRFESVLSLCWDKCLAASKRLINPLDSSYIPPLLKPECVLLSLLVTTAFTNPKMKNLLPELTKALKETILTKSSGFGFHHLCACCRMFAALCRLQNDIEQIQFVACELLLKSMSSHNLPTITALASIWPRSFARNHAAPPVQVGDQLKTEGVDMQPLSLTLEVVMIDIARKKKELQDKGPVSNLKKLCQWQQLPGQAVTKLTKCLVEILESSKHVFIDAPSTLTPRPSKHAYAVVLALRLLSCSQGWAWTNDTLIRGHLWPLLQQWNRAPPSVRDSTIVCITRLIGFTAQIGVAEDPNSSSIQQLQKVFISLLQKEKMKKVSLCVQLAVADALIDLSPCSSSSVTTSTISQWITQLCQEGIATAPAMAQLYGPRLQQIKQT